MTKEKGMAKITIPHHACLKGRILNVTLYHACLVGGWWQWQILASV